MNYKPPPFLILPAAVRTFKLNSSDKVYFPRNMEEIKERSVLSPKYRAGPMGLGDPNDTSLRHVERDILIPKIMQDRAYKEKCVDVDKEFAACCKKNGLLMTWKCKQETKALTDCMTRWFNDEEFKEECKQIYLDKRRRFRETGEREPEKKFKSSCSFSTA